MRKEPPFIILILFAIISWSVTHIVNRTIERPLLEIQEIKITEISSADLANRLQKCSSADILENEKTFLKSYQLSNISRDNLFRDIALIIKETRGTIYGMRVVSVPPTMAGDTKPVCTSDNAVYLQEITLHPMGKLSIEILSRTEKQPDFYLESANSPVGLVMSNLETWLVKHETGFLIFISLLAFFSAVIYYILQAKLGKNDV